MTEAIEVMASGDHHFVEGSRFDECIKIHAWLAERVQQARPSVFLSGGDVYHKASTPTERIEAARFFQAVADVCPVVITKGNHDRWRDLTLLASLRARHPIHVIEDQRVVIAGGVAIAGLAWPTRASDLDEDATHEAYRAVLRGLGQELSLWEGPRILLGHLQIEGALTGAGQPIAGGGLTISLADVMLARADAVVSSHIHLAQEWPLGGDAYAFYCGSPYRTDHGEMEEKSVLSLAFEGHRCRWMRDRTPARPMLHVAGTWTGMDGECPGIQIDLPEGSDLKDADIRLRYVVPSEYREQARRHAEELRTLWTEGGAATVKLEAETLPSTRARAPEVAIARDLPAKLDALYTSKNDPMEPARRARILRYAASVVARLEALS